MGRSTTFGVFLSEHADFKEIRSEALRCEELGYDNVWLQDHLLIKGTECWTTLSALAHATNKIRLGSLLSCNLFRHPALLAKMAATVDNISNGRLEFGIGAGNYEKEFAAYGISMPGAKERLERLHESIQIIKLLWTQDKSTFEGKYYSIEAAECSPKPVQTPHPSITIGGTGFETTVKLAAALADRYNPAAVTLTLEKAKKFFGKLDAECERIGRPSGEIEKVWFGFALASHDKAHLDRAKEGLTPEQVEAAIIGTPEECIAKIGSYIDVGVGHFILFTPPGVAELGRPMMALESFAAEVFPSFR